MCEPLVRLKTRNERLADIDREIAALYAWKKKQDADANACFNEKLMTLTDKRRKLLAELAAGQK